MKTIINPYKKKIPEINSVKITEEAFKKMNLYASVVSEIVGSDKECVGTLMNYKDRHDNIARDIHLWKDQTVTSASGSFGDPSDDYTEAKNRGMDLVGLWHSHGSIGVFHSHDDNNVLSQMYKYIKNRIITGEKEKSIECIVDGESVKLFEEGSNKEIRLKVNGNIENIKYVERDYCYVLNSIVINKNSYSGGYVNPQLGCDYDAEVWAGYDRKECKRVENASIELVDEKNEIELNEEELVNEVGSKVKFEGTYLKDLPNYQKVLNRYKKSEDVKPKDESIEQLVEETPEEPEDKKKISLEGIIPFTFQKTTSGNGYHKEIYDFYSIAKENEDVLISSIGLVGEILAGDYTEEGKRYWFWDDRIKKAEEVYGQFKRGLGKYHKEALGDLLDILNINYYAKKKYGKKLNKMCKKMGFKKKIKRKKSSGWIAKIFRRKKKCKLTS